MRAPGELTRRGLLAGLAVAGVGAAFPAAARATPALLTAPANLARGASFPEGVMAGVPRTDGATLWTRVPGRTAASLELLVSREPDLRRPRALAIRTKPDANGTVHVNLTGLQPGEEYWYQFRGADAASGVGRFRTLRPPDSRAPVRIGFFSCQAYTEGFYAAHRHLAAEDLDLVVCLGDYVYEATYPGVRGFDLNLFPQTLGAMRRKYTAYRRDPDLRAMHARHAFVPMWDDHEFRNNYSRAGWSFPLVLGDLAELDRLTPHQKRMEWAWRAWFEHMPMPRTSGDPRRTYHRLRLGRTVELFTQDSRQYRDTQACGDPDSATVCAEADAPGRTLLGAAQEKWLLRGLRSSRADWKVLANAGMLMGMVVADDGARHSTDAWDGYGAQRTRLLTALGERDIGGAVVVTGDQHESYAAELWDTGFAPGTTTGAQPNPPGRQRNAVEFVVPSVTSANTGDQNGAAAAATQAAQRLARNPHMAYADLSSHGYGVLEADRAGVRFAYRYVARADRDAPVTKGPEFVVGRSPLYGPLRLSPA
jgi:alkaline phosphatase D